MDASLRLSARPSPAYLWRFLRHPLQASREIAAWKSALPGGLVVLALGLYLTVSLVISHLNRDYPPPSDALAVWIDAWGSFAMLPVVPIPLEQYRLFMAVIALPVVFGSWLATAGVAHLLGRLFRRPAAAFRQYLNLFAFSFFPFFFLAVILDGLYTAVLGPYVVPGLQNQYGPLARAFFANFPPLNYTLLFGLGGVYNALAAYSAGRMNAWQAGITGWLTFAIPTILVALLFR